MQNVFIVHTPFHVFVAEAIVSNSLGQSNGDNVVLLELSRDHVRLNHDLWSAVEHLEPVGPSTVGRQKYLMSEQNMCVLREYAAKDPQTRLFLSDIAWPMNNRAFFDHQLRRSVEFCLFSDGIGTYARPMVTRALFTRSLAKGVNGLLRRGVRYRSYLGSQFGVDRSEIAAIYAPKSELVRCNPSKRRDVVLDAAKRAVAFQPAKGLFLDQPYWLHMPEAEWKATIRQAVTFMQSLGIADWSYKGHHAGRQAEGRYYEGLGYRIVHSDVCAEQVVADSGFGTVVSYSSSALFNLKCMYGDRLRCVALFTRAVSTANGFNDNTSAALTDLFRAVGVEIVEIAEGEAAG